VQGLDPHTCSPVVLRIQTERKTLITTCVSYEPECLKVAKLELQENRCRGLI